MSKIDLITETNRRIDSNEKDFFNSMGGLHDCKIESIIFNNELSLFRLLIDDLYSNFLGLPEYIELKSIYLNIEIDKLIDIRLDLYDTKINIYDIQIEKNIIHFDFSSGGKIEIEYKSIYISEN